MTQEKISDTKTIAEFMEVKNLTEFNAEVHLNDYKSRFSFNEKGKISYVDELKYHTSWDWLMPVWVKFSDLQLEDNSIFMAHRYSISQIILFMTIEEVFTAIANAIKWYNEIKL